MKFYSETTKKFYSTPEECIEAESKFKAEQEAVQKEIKERKEKRAAAAKEVEDAFAEADKARKKANKLLSDFCKTFGSYHLTIRDDEALFDSMFKWPWHW